MVLILIINVSLYIVCFTLKGELVEFKMMVWLGATSLVKWKPVFAVVRFFFVFFLFMKILHVKCRDTLVAVTANTVYIATIQYKQLATNNRQELYK